MTQPDQAQLAALFSKARKVLGEAPNKLADPQWDLLVGGLEQILISHEGDVSKVTEDEIRGQYELFTEYVYPTSFVAVRDAYLERLQDD